MRRTLAKVLALAGAGLLLISINPNGTARADGGEDGNPGWVKETTDRGCHRYIHLMVYPQSTQSQGESYVWTGPCTPGQAINGGGTFYRQFERGFVMAYTGAIVNGFPNGPTRVTMYDGVNASSWLTARPVSDETIVFEMGCSEFFPQCQPGQASNLVTIPPVSPAHFPLPGGPSTFAGASTPAASAPEEGPSSRSNYGDCQPRLQPGDGSSFWRVVNTCSYKVIGRWCYLDDGPFSCEKRRAGGFGPVSPGRHEAISGPGDGRTEYRVTWCDYDDWNKGECRLGDPWDVKL